MSQLPTIEVTRHVRVLAQKRARTLLGLSRRQARKFAREMIREERARNVANSIEEKGNE